MGDPRLLGGPLEEPRGVVMDTAEGVGGLASGRSPGRVRFGGLIGRPRTRAKWPALSASGRNDGAARGGRGRC